MKAASSEVAPADEMFVPGANRSTHVPKFEKLARASLGSLAATVSSARHASRRVVACVAALVAGARHVRDSGSDRVRDRVVDGRVAVAPDAHVRDRGSHAVRSDPVDAGDELREGPGAVATQDTHRHEGDVLGDTVRLSADDARDVGAVHLAGRIRRVTVVDGVEGCDRCTTFEFGVRRPDGRVQDVRRHAAPVGVEQVRTVDGQVTVVDPVETPWRAELDRVGVDVSVLRDRGDRWVPAELARRLPTSER